MKQKNKSAILLHNRKQQQTQLQTLRAMIKIKNKIEKKTTKDTKKRETHVPWQLG